MRLADALVEALIGLGVERVYGVTGRGSLFLTDAVARHPRMRFIATHHEQSAGYAAAGEAALTKQLSVCVVSTGVGASNAFSAALSAYQDQLPVLFISGQNFSNATSSLVETSKRTFGEQEFDVVKAVNQFTKFASVVGPNSDFERLFNQAVSMALGGRPGPVWLDIPLDVQSKSIPPVNLDLPYPKGFEVQQKPRFGRLEADRPLLLLGQGASAMYTRGDLTDALVSWGGAVVAEPSAIDAIYQDRLNSYIGTVGTLGGNRDANYALSQCDLLVSIGSTFRSGLFGDSMDLSNLRHVIAFDFDDRELANLTDLFGSGVVLNFCPFAELEGFLDAGKIGAASDNQPEISLSQIDTRLFADDPKALDLHTVAKILPSSSNYDEIFVTDSGLVEVVLPNELRLQGEQRLIHPHSQGAMGYALGAALGSGLASGGSRVTVVIGDGSLMMNLQELVSLRSHGLSFRLIVIENGMYSIIRKRQQELFRGRTIGTDASNGVEAISFEGLAHLLGASYSRVETASDFEGALSNAAKLHLIEVQGKVGQDYRRVGRVVQASGSVEVGTHARMLPLGEV